MNTISDRKTEDVKNQRPRSSIKLHVTSLLAALRNVRFLQFGLNLFEGRSCVAVWRRLDHVHDRNVGQWNV